MQALKQLSKRVYYLAEYIWRSKVSEKENQRMNENSIKAIGAISLKVYIFAEPNKDDLGYSIYFKTFDH